MKTIFEKSILLDAILPALGSVSAKNTIPAIEGINLNCTEDGKCVITAYDLEKGYRTEISCDVVRPGNYIINAQKFAQIIRAMPSGFITIDIDSSNIAKIVSGKSEFEIYAMNGADFPQLPALRGDHGFVIKQGILRNMITKTQFAVAANDMRPELNGAFFKIEGNKLTVVSCDGSKMAIKEQITDIENKNDDQSELDMQFIIPAKTLIEIMKLLSDNDETVSIRLTRKYVILFIGSVIFFSRLIENEYIDYNRFLPKAPKTFVKIDCEAFLGALERASLVTEDKTMGQAKSILRCNFEDNMLKISSVSVSGKVYDEVFTEKQGDDIVIGFNCRYLLDALRACDSEKLKLSLTSQLMGMTLQPAEEGEDGTFTFLVLPVKIKE
ncbi:MAG: DNA polymerase III subunit beta [Clostridia bacterium]|nr:DNA polymerase III subunit beta [Clostridia bacterium]